MDKRWSLLLVKPLLTGFSSNSSDLDTFGREDGGVWGKWLSVCFCREYAVLPCLVEAIEERFGCRGERITSVGLSPFAGLASQRDTLASFRGDDDLGFVVSGAEEMDINEGIFRFFIGEADNAFDSVGSDSFFFSGELLATTTAGDRALSTTMLSPSRSAGIDLCIYRRSTSLILALSCSITKGISNSMRSTRLSLAKREGIFVCFHECLC